MTTDATDTPPAGPPLGRRLHAQLGPLPPADPRRALQYDAIRYVVGYPESYLQEYARTYAAEQVAAVRDCRLCAHFTRKSGGCVSVVQCVDSKQFKATAPRQYWIAGPNDRVTRAGTVPCDGSA